MAALNHTERREIAIMITQILLGAAGLVILALAWYAWDCESQITRLMEQIDHDTEQFSLDSAQMQSMLNEIQRLRIAAGEIEAGSIDVELIMAIHDGTLPIHPFDDLDDLQAEDIAAWEDEGGTPQGAFVLLCDGCHPKGYSSGLTGECTSCGVDVGLEIGSPHAKLDPGSRQPHDCEDDGYSDYVPYLPL